MRSSSKARGPWPGPSQRTNSAGLKSRRYASSCVPPPGDSAYVTGRPIRISRSAQTCALGAAIAGAVVAGKRAGGYISYAEAQQAMTGLKPRVFRPKAEAHAVYQRLFALYRKLHDKLHDQAAR